jgi:hypothetical protein
MEFNSHGNKGLLWNTLVEGGVFTGLDNSKFQDIKQLFETTISNVSTSAQRTQQINQEPISLVQLNKQFITEFPAILNNYKNPSTPAQNITEVYTNQQFSSQRTNDINLKVKQQQAERENVVLKPKELDFTQELDEKPISNMDEQLAQMMADRNIDMKNLPEDKEKAASWIGSGNKTDNQHLTDKSTNAITAQKKVTFADSTDSQPVGSGILGDLQGIVDISDSSLDTLNSTDNAKLDSIIHILNEVKETSNRTQEMVIELHEYIGVKKNQ